MIMSNKCIGSLTLVVTLLFLCAPASAHHGNSAYDEQARVPIKGTVTEFVWTNPHSQIYLDVKDKNGKIALGRRNKQSEYPDQGWLDKTLHQAGRRSHHHSVSR